MVTRYDDMVVSYRMRQKIISLLFVCQLYHLLGTTEVWLGLTSHQLALSDKAAFKVT